MSVLQPTRILLLIPSHKLASSLPSTQFWSDAASSNRSIDIDRFFETDPPIVICRNELATRLARPQVYVEQDAEIWRQVEKADVSDDRMVHEKDGAINIERV